MGAFQEDITHASCTNILKFLLWMVALLQDYVDVRYRVSKLMHLAIFGAKKPAPAF